MPLTYFPPPAKSLAQQEQERLDPGATLWTPNQLNLWTKVNLTTAYEGGALCADMGATGSAESRYLHTSPASVTSVVLCAGFIQIGGGHPMWGPMMLDSAGNGVGMSLYSNSSSFFIVGITAGVFNNVIVASKTMPVNFSSPNIGTGRVWIRLRKSGTTYTADYSLDGSVWSPTISGTSAGTPTTAAVGQFKRIAGGANTEGSKMVFHWASTK